MANSRSNKRRKATQRSKGKTNVKKNQTQKAVAPEKEEDQIEKVDTVPTDDIDKATKEVLEEAAKEVEEAAKKQQEPVEEEGSKEEPEEVEEEANPRLANFFSRYITGMATNKPSQLNADMQISLQKELEKEIVNAFRADNWRENVLDIIGRMNHNLFAPSLVHRHVYSLQGKRQLSTQFESLSRTLAMSAQLGVAKVAGMIDAEKDARNITDPQIKARYIELFSKG